MANRKQLTPWQILVIEQLLERAMEFEKHKYDEASLKSLADTWKKADRVSITLK